MHKIPTFSGFSVANRKILEKNESFTLQNLILITKVSQTGAKTAPVFMSVSFGNKLTLDYTYAGMAK